jgi:ketosteroid isomerase-like protein
MSSTHVEVVKRNLDAWRQGDLDAWLATFDAAVEWHTALGQLVDGAARIYRGHDGMRELWRFYTTELQSFKNEVQELHETAGDDVVLLGRFEWRGPVSGLMCESHVGMVMTVRETKIVRTRAFFSHHEALEAAGMRRWHGSSRGSGSAVSAQRGSERAS